MADWGWGLTCGLGWALGLDLELFLLLLLLGGFWVTSLPSWVRVLAEGRILPPIFAGSWRLMDYGLRMELFAAGVGSIYQKRRRVAR